MFFSRFVSSTVVMALLATPVLAQMSGAIDYRNPAKRTTIAEPGAAVDDLPHHRVAMVALSLGRSTEALSIKDVEAIANALVAGESIPANLVNTWEKLVRIAQIESSATSLPVYFQHGFEFETMHPGGYAYAEFESGAKRFEKLLAGTFGIPGKLTLGHADHEAYMFDDYKRTWKLMTETVRMNDGYDGYELVSPVMENPEDLQLMGSFIWRLGQDDYGQSSKMTGAHQTFSIFPKGFRGTSQQAGLMITNMLLMQAQFGPLIHQLLEVKRMGGYENFFMRPLALDYQDMLSMLASTPASQISGELIDKLMNETFVDKEFDIQAKKQVELDLLSEEDYQHLKNAPVEERQNYRASWKFRDTRIKINTREPEKSLFEVRIGDYAPERPEKQLMKTFLYQTMLNRAWEMTMKGEVFKLDIPVRDQRESDKSYWERIGTQTSSSFEAFMSALNITDSNIQNLIAGNGFKATDPKMKVGDHVTYAFEMEAYTDDLIPLILPRDPKLRKQWREMSDGDKAQAVKDTGFKFQSTYTMENFLALTTNFYVDFAHFPFMSPDLHLETSGNWEVKSNVRGFKSIADLEVAMKDVDWSIEEDFYGPHVHMFVPNSVFDGMTSQQKDEFVAFMGRLSTMMATRAYAEADAKTAAHYLDSWSLDRFSPKDLRQILDHLNGGPVLNSLDQKYHNVAFRPVGGGIDIELRDLDPDSSYAIGLLQRIRYGLKNKNFGGVAFSQENSLFMEFKDHENLADVKRYTLVGAMEASGYSLTTDEKDLLHKFQFEIYKPSMSEYMEFADHAGIAEVADQDLDVKYARTNFENNLAIPLLNYDEQTYLSAADKQALTEKKTVFLKRVYTLMKKVEGDKNYNFLKSTGTFLHLAKWLKRSLHMSKPAGAGEDNSKEKRKLLDDLVINLRGLSIKFVQESKVDQMLEASLQPSKPAVTTSAVVPAAALAASRMGLMCSKVFLP